MSIQERSHLNATYAASVLADQQVCGNIRKYMQKRSLLSAICVESVLEHQLF